LANYSASSVLSPAKQLNVCKTLLTDVDMLKIENCGTEVLLERGNRLEERAAIWLLG
jgi:hypothetical protein